MAKVRATPQPSSNGATGTAPSGKSTAAGASSPVGPELPIASKYSRKTEAPGDSSDIRKPPRAVVAGAVMGRRRFETIDDLEQRLALQPAPMPPGIDVAPPASQVVDIMQPIMETLALVVTASQSSSGSPIGSGPGGDIHPEGIKPLSPHLMEARSRVPLSSQYLPQEIVDADLALRRTFVAVHVAREADAGRQRDREAAATAYEQALEISRSRLPPGATLPYDRVDTDPRLVRALATVEAATRAHVDGRRELDSAEMAYEQALNTYVWETSADLREKSEIDPLVTPTVAIALKNFVAATAKGTLAYAIPAAVAVDVFAPQTASAANAAAFAAMVGLLQEPADQLAIWLSRKMGGASVQLRLSSSVRHANVGATKAEANNFSLSMPSLMSYSAVHAAMSLIPGINAMPGAVFGRAMAATLASSAVQNAGVYFAAKNLLERYGVTETKYIGETTGLRTALDGVHLKKIPELKHRTTLKNKAIEVGVATAGSIAGSAAMFGVWQTLGTNARTAAEKSLVNILFGFLVNFGVQAAAKVAFTYTANDNRHNAFKFQAAARKTQIARIREPSYHAYETMLADAALLMREPAVFDELDRSTYFAAVDTLSGEDWRRARRGQPNNMHWMSDRLKSIAQAIDPMSPEDQAFAAGRKRFPGDSQAQGWRQEANPRFDRDRGPIRGTMVHIAAKLRAAADRLDDHDPQNSRPRTLDERAFGSNLVAYKNFILEIQGLVAMAQYQLGADAIDDPDATVFRPTGDRHLDDIARAGIEMQQHVLQVAGALFPLIVASHTMVRQDAAHDVDRVMRELTRFPLEIDDVARRAVKKSVSGEQKLAGIDEADRIADILVDSEYLAEDIGEQLRAQGDDADHQLLAVADKILVLSTSHDRQLLEGRIALLHNTARVDFAVPRRETAESVFEPLFDAPHMPGAFPIDDGERRARYVESIRLGRDAAGQPLAIQAMRDEFNRLRQEAQGTGRVSNDVEVNVTQADVDRTQAARRKIQAITDILGPNFIEGLRLAVDPASFSRDPEVNGRRAIHAIIEGDKSLSTVDFERTAAARSIGLSPELVDLITRLMHDMHFHATNYTGKDNGFLLLPHMSISGIIRAKFDPIPSKQRGQKPEAKYYDAAKQKLDYADLDIDGILQSQTMTSSQRYRRDASITGYDITDAANIEQEVKLTVRSAVRLGILKAALNALATNDLTELNSIFDGSYFKNPANKPLSAIAGAGEWTAFKEMISDKAHGFLGVDNPGVRKTIETMINFGLAQTVHCDYGTPQGKTSPLDKLTGKVSEGDKLIALLLDIASSLNSLVSYDPLRVRGNEDVADKKMIINLPHGMGDGKFFQQKVSHMRKIIDNFEAAEGKFTLLSDWSWDVVNIHMLRATIDLLAGHEISKPIRDSFHNVLKMNEVFQVDGSMADTAGDIGKRAVMEPMKKVDSDVDAYLYMKASDACRRTVMRECEKLEVRMTIRALFLSPGTDFFNALYLLNEERGKVGYGSDNLSVENKRHGSAANQIAHQMLGPILDLVDAMELWYPEDFGPESRRQPGETHDNSISNNFLKRTYEKMLDDPEARLRQLAMEAWTIEEQPFDSVSGAVPQSLKKMSPEVTALIESNDPTLDAFYLMRGEVLRGAGITASTGQGDMSESIRQNDGFARWVQTTAPEIYRELMDLKARVDREEGREGSSSSSKGKAVAKVPSQESGASMSQSVPDDSTGARRLGYMTSTGLASTTSFTPTVPPSASRGTGSRDTSNAPSGSDGSGTRSAPASDGGASSASQPLAAQ